MKKRSAQRTVTMLGLLMLLPMTAVAHTGIGEASGLGAGFGHPFHGLDHALAMLAVGFWAAQMGGRAQWIVPGTFVAVMLFGGFLGIAQAPIPLVEEGILVSILVLGVLIAGAFTFRTLIGGLVVGFFAVFHGLAHGAEMPLAAGAAAYIIGFVMATASLHGAGMVLGTFARRFDFTRISRFAGAAVALSGVYLAAVS